MNDEISAGKSPVRDKKKVLLRNVKNDIDDSKPVAQKEIIPDEMTSSVRKTKCQKTQDISGNRKARTLVQCCIPLHQLLLDCIEVVHHDPIYILALK